MTSKAHVNTIIDGAVDSDKEIMAIIDFLIMRFNFKSELEKDDKKKEEHQFFLHKLNTIDEPMRAKLAFELKNRKQKNA